MPCHSKLVKQNNNGVNGDPLLCPSCREALVIYTWKNITSKVESCEMCSSIANVRYECGHSSCLACYKLLKGFKVDKCPWCQSALKLLWIGGSNQIFIRALDGSTKTMYVNLEKTTGKCLENMVRYTEYYTNCEIRLISSGKQLGWDLPLCNYKIFVSQTIHVVFKLRGD